MSCLCAVPVRAPEITIPLPHPEKQVAHVTLKLRGNALRKRVIGFTSFPISSAMGGTRRELGMELTAYSGSVGGKITLKMRVVEKGVIVEDWMALGLGLPSLDSMPAVYTNEAGVSVPVRRLSHHRRSSQMSPGGHSKASPSPVATRIRLAAESPVTARLPNARMFTSDAPTSPHDIVCEPDMVLSPKASPHVVLMDNPILAALRKKSLPSPVTSQPKPPPSPSSTPAALSTFRSRSLPSARPSRR